ncbi:MAG: TetR/AcrR family transcriptional regulator [Burkholderiaceae bacterium]
MARTKQFDPDTALGAAVEVFREHGYAGASAQMLTGAMGIGKQSLYDTYGGKWPLYCAALQRYSADETGRHIAELGAGRSARAGLERLLQRVVAEAQRPCLGIGSVQEFGQDSEGSAALAEIRERSAQALRAALIGRIRDAQAAGELSAEVAPRQAAAFLVANIAALRLAARDGAGEADLRAQARLVLRALD